MLKIVTAIVYLKNGPLPPEVNSFTLLQNHMYVEKLVGEHPVAQLIRSDKHLVNKLLESTPKNTAKRS